MRLRAPMQRSSPCQGRSRTHEASRDLLQAPALPDSPLCPRTAERFAARQELELQTVRLKKQYEGSGMGALQERRAAEGELLEPFQRAGPGRAGNAPPLCTHALCVILQQITPKKKSPAWADSTKTNKSGLIWAWSASKLKPQEDHIKHSGSSHHLQRNLILTAR